MQSAETSRALRNLRDRHLRFFSEFVAEVAAEADTDLESFLELIGQELANIEAALGWAVTSGQSEHGLQIASKLLRFWLESSRFAYGRSWLERLLQSEGAGKATQARAAAVVGELASFQGDSIAAEQRYAQSYRLYSELGMRNEAARTLIQQGWATWHLGKPRLALEFAQQSVEIFEPLIPADLATAVSLAAWCHVRIGDPDLAVELHTHSIKTLREAGDLKNLLPMLSAQANIHENAGDRAAVRRTREEQIATFRQIGDRRGVMDWLGMLGRTRFQDGDWTRAAEAFRELEQLGQDFGSPARMTEALRGLADIAQAEGRSDESTALLNEALAHSLQVTDPSEDDVIQHCWLLIHLGDRCFNANDKKEARRYFEEAAATLRRASLQSSGHVPVLWRLAAIAETMGDAQTAALRYQEEAATWAGIEDVRNEPRMHIAEANVARVRGNRAEAKKFAMAAVTAAESQAPRGGGIWATTEAARLVIRLDDLALAADFLDRGAAMLEFARGNDGARLLELKAQIDAMLNRTESALESLHQLRSLPRHQLNAPAVIWAAALVLHANGEAPTAARAFGVVRDVIVEGLRTFVPNPGTERLGRALEELERELRQILGDESFELELQRGRETPPDDFLEELFSRI